MRQVELFEVSQSSSLKNLLNTWLEDHASYKIISIKYQVAFMSIESASKDGRIMYPSYSVLISYESKHPQKSYGELKRENIEAKDLKINRKT